MKRLILCLILLCSVSAWATVNTLIYTVSYSCTGGFGPFPFAFPISDPAALTVSINGTAMNPANYTVVAVNNNYNNGGSVTLGSLYPCLSGATLVVARTTPITQTLKFYDNMPIPMVTFERGLDKLTEIVQELAGGSIELSPYESVFALAGVIGSSGTPASTVIPVETFTRTVIFPANFGASKDGSSSQGTCGTNPTNTSTFTILKNGVSVGAAQISTACVFSFTTTAGVEITFVAGDRLTIQVPLSSDATLSDVAFTLAGAWQ